MSKDTNMRTIEQGQHHVLVVERSDGWVGFAASRHPDQFLAALSNQIIIERTEVRPGACAPAVADQLCGGFEFAHGERWGLIDFEDATRELDAFNLVTGQRIALRGLRRKDRVRVAGVGKGRIAEFTSTGRAVVDLEERFERLTVPRSLLKRVVRLDVVNT